MKEQKSFADEDEIDFLNQREFERQIREEELREQEERAVHEFERTIRTKVYTKPKPAQTESQRPATTLTPPVVVPSVGEKKSQKKGPLIMPKIVVQNKRKTEEPSSSKPFSFCK